MRARRAENESAGHERMQREPFRNHRITETGQNLSPRSPFFRSLLEVARDLDKKIEDLLREAAA